MLGLDGIVAIGGDGTFAGCLAFSEEYPISVIGIPATIDNEEVGNGGAANQIATIIKEKLGLDLRVTVLGHTQRGGAPTKDDDSEVLKERIRAEIEEELKIQIRAEIEAEIRKNSANKSKVC